MAAKQRRKRGARGNVGRPVSGGVGEIAAPVAGGGSSTRGDVSPPQNILHLFVTLLIELLGERVRERQALEAVRRLPHWGHENGGVRSRHARSLRRGVRCAGRHRCRCGKRAAATVAVRLRAAATKRKRLAPAARPATRAPGGISAQRRVAGRFRSRYGVRTHAPRVRARGRVSWQPSTRSGAAATLGT